MSKLEATYVKTAAIKRRFETADKKGEEHREAAIAEYRSIVDEFCGDDPSKGYVWGHYATSREIGNAFLDFDGIVWPREIPGLVKVLREAGVEKFTLSDTSSGVMGAAWAFKKQGCLLEGLIEINDRPDLFTRETLKKPALLFKVG